MVSFGPYFALGTLLGLSRSRATFLSLFASPALPYLVLNEPSPTAPIRPVMGRGSLAGLCSPETSNPLHSTKGFLNHRRLLGRLAPSFVVGHCRAKQADSSPRIDRSYYFRYGMVGSLRVPVQPKRPELACGNPAPRGLRFSGWGGLSDRAGRSASLHGGYCNSGRMPGSCARKEHEQMNIRRKITRGGNRGQTGRFLSHGLDSVSPQISLD